MAVTDATMITREIDSIVLVIKAGQTDKKAFHHTMANLKNINAPLDGIVMNAVTSKVIMDRIIIIITTNTIITIAQMKMILKHKIILIL